MIKKNVISKQELHINSSETLVSVCSPEADTVCTANLTEVLFLCGFVVSA